VRQLNIFLGQYESIPFKALTYLTGHVNYGGRVTDDIDRRTLLTLLGDYMSESVLSSSYQFDSDGVYYAPGAEDSSVSDYLKYIRSLPINDPPAVFGLHGNADLTYGQVQARALLDTLLSVQPREAAGGGRSIGEIVADVAGDLLSRIREPFDRELVLARHPITYAESMTTVLNQECARYNGLIEVILSSLATLQKAIRGEVVMSSEFEKVYNALYDGRVPEMWAAKAYPSLASLGDWFKDLTARLRFLQTWVDAGTPAVFWLSGFFFPQAFLTATLQNFARKYRISVDTLEFAFSVCAAEPALPPGDGAYVRGIFLEGARWDQLDQSLVESRSKELYTALPTMWLLPRRRDAEKAAAEAAEARKAKKFTYSCPLYRTATRAGTLSTTGHSTNYVMHIELPSKGLPGGHWVRRGTAALLSSEH
jgi:dynein heavy chain